MFKKIMILIFIFVVGACRTKAKRTEKPRLTTLIVKLFEEHPVLKVSEKTGSFTKAIEKSKKFDFNKKRELLKVVRNLEQDII
jgi:hypothetical protein